MMRTEVRTCAGGCGRSIRTDGHYDLCATCAVKEYGERWAVMS